MTNPYIHQVHYYETDRMGVTHHSNYVRIMEEARVDFMAQLGWPYARMEAEGIVSPVTAVNVKYLAPTTFSDRIAVEVYVSSFNGVTLEIGYRMTKMGEEPKMVLTGTSEHVFLNPQGRFARMKRELPAFYELLTNLAAENASPA